MGFLCKRVEIGENGERREESSDACQITTRLGPSAQVGSRTLSPTERGRVVVKLNGTCLKYSACSQTPKTKTAFEAVSEADLHLTFFIMTGRFVLAFCHENYFNQQIISWFVLFDSSSGFKPKYDR